MTIEELQAKLNVLVDAAKTAAQSELLAEQADADVMAAQAGATVAHATATTDLNAEATAKADLLAGIEATFPVPAA